MSIAYVKEVGKLASTGSSLVVSVASAPSSGDVVIARIGFRASGTVTTTGVTDSQGNTWTVHVQNNTSNGHVAIASTSMDVATLTTSDTITVSLSGSASNGVIAIIDEFSGIDTSSGRFDQSATGTATTTSRDGGTTSTTTAANELVVGCYAANGAETSFTDGTGFSDFTTPFLSRTTTAMVEGQYQIVSSTGTQTATATGGLSASSAGAIATFVAASGGSTKTITPDGASGVATVTGAVSGVYSHISHWDDHNTGLATLAVNPTQVGDLMVLSVREPSGSSISGVSGGGVTTWTKVGLYTGPTQVVEIWWGKVTTTGSATVTITYVGTPGSNCELVVDQYHSSAGTSWSSGNNSSSTNSSSTTITYPTITSPSSLAIYHGYATAGGDADAGTSSGFVFGATAQNNQYCYLLSTPASTSESPSFTQSPAGTSFAVGAYFYTSSSAPITPASITGTATVSATVTYNKKRITPASVTGAATVSASVRRNPRAIKPATVTAVATVSATVTYNKKRITPATIAGAATFSGTLTKGGTKLLSGAVSGVATISATVTYNKKRVSPDGATGKTSIVCQDLEGIKPNIPAPTYPSMFRDVRGNGKEDRGLWFKGFDKRT